MARRPPHGGRRGHAGLSGRAAGAPGRRGRRAAGLSRTDPRKIFDAYQDSKEFDRKAPKTQKDYRRILDTLRDEFGTMPVSVLTVRGTRAKFLDWRDEYAEDAGRAADYHWTVLNIAINWALGREWPGFDRNPFAKAGKAHEGSRADKVWSAEQIRTFLAAAPPHITLPFLLALYTGQRQGDLLRLTWGQYDGERIGLRQGKTGVYVSIKLAVPARRYLDAWRAGLPAPPSAEDRILVTARGGDPWTEDGFRASWGKVKRDAAGIVDRTFHDLRGTAVTMLAMAGCSIAEIATITGHSLRDVQEILDRHYFHRDTRMADSGIDKLDAMIATMASPANDAAVDPGRSQKPRNGYVGSKRAAMSRA